METTTTRSPNIFQCYRVDGVIAASATFNKSLYEECEEFDILSSSLRVEGTKSSHVVVTTAPQAKSPLSIYIA